MPELELMGPVGLKRLLSAAPSALGRWAEIPRARIFEVEPDGQGRGRLEREDLVLTSVANGHTPEALSWRVEPTSGSETWSLAYSGDTPDNPRVAELAHAAEVFLCECSFPDEQASANHLTPSSAARLAQSAQVQRLLLTHFYPTLEPQAARERAGRLFDGPIELARDGLSVELG